MEECGWIVELSLWMLLCLAGLVGFCLFVWYACGPDADDDGVPKGRLQDGWIHYDCTRETQGAVGRYRINCTTLSVQKDEYGQWTSCEDPQVLALSKKVLEKV